MERALTNVDESHDLLCGLDFTVRHKLSITLVPDIYVKISFVYFQENIFLNVCLPICVLSPGQQSKLVLKFY